MQSFILFYFRVVRGCGNGVWDFGRARSGCGVGSNGVVGVKVSVCLCDGTNDCVVQTKCSSESIIGVWANCRSGEGVLKFGG